MCVVVQAGMGMSVMPGLQTIIPYKWLQNLLC